MVSGYGSIGNSKGKVAKHALMFMLRNIVGNWKQALGYHYTCSMNSEEMKDLIKDIIKTVYYKTKFMVNNYCKIII